MSTECVILVALLVSVKKVITQQFYIMSPNFIACQIFTILLIMYKETCISRQPGEAS